MGEYIRKKKCGKVVYSYTTAYRACFVQCMTIPPSAITAPNVPSASGARTTEPQTRNLFYCEYYLDKSKKRDRFTAIKCTSDGYLAWTRILVFDGKFTYQWEKAACGITIIEQCGRTQYSSILEDHIFIIAKAFVSRFPSIPIPPSLKNVSS